MLIPPPTIPRISRFNAVACCPPCSLNICVSDKDLCARWMECRSVVSQCFEQIGKPRCSAVFPDTVQATQAHVKTEAFETWTGFFGYHCLVCNPTSARHRCVGQGAALRWLIVRVSCGRPGKITMWIKGTCSVQMKTINEPHYPYFWRVLDFFKDIYNAVLFLITAAFTGHFYLCVCEFLIIHVRQVIFTVNSNVVFFHLLCLCWILFHCLLSSSQYLAYFALQQTFL